MCTIYIVRHGQTEWNRRRLVQGHIDIPLNEHGKSEAALLAKTFATLEFSAAFSSDLMRAKETAEFLVAGKGLNVQIASQFRERSWGVFEGRPFDEIKQRHKEEFCEVLERFSPDANKLHPELASIETYQNAVERVLPLLVQLSEEHSGKNVLVVSHGGILKGLLMHLAGDEFKNPIVHNTGYVKLNVSAGKFVVEGVEGIAKAG